MTMTPDLLTAIASIGTLLVITATAIAGFVQLRHLQASNQIETLAEFRAAFETPEIQGAPEAMRAIRERLNDPESRAELLRDDLPVWMRPVMPALRLFEILGVYVRQGIVSERIVCDMWSPVILSSWEEFEPLIAVMRRTRGRSLFENFELIAFYSKRWISNETSTYPKNVPRLRLEDPWSAIDGQSDAGNSSRN
jgi:hypothetical protein